jgi:hypothetical protein
VRDAVREAPDAEPRGLWGAGLREAAGRDRGYSPRTRQPSGERDTRRNQMQPPQSPQCAQAAAPGPSVPRSRRWGSGTPGPYLFGASTGRRPGLGADGNSVDSI